MILAVKPVAAIKYEDEMSDDLLYTMLEELGTVSSIYYRPASEFIHPTCGPQPIQTNSPIPDEEMDIIGEDENEDDSENDSGDEDDDLNIFSD